MSRHEKINYLEIPATNIEAAKRFFASVFEWSFQDFGPEYTAFSNAGIDGGFYQSDLTVSTKSGSVLVVFYSNNLEETSAKIEAAGGLVIKPIFEFPGGRRFHFSDTNGNEYAVWSDLGI
jgi:hypothetical protein